MDMLCSSQITTLKFPQSPTPLHYSALYSIIKAMIIHFLVKPYLLFLETHKLHNHYGHCSDYTVSQRHHSLSSLPCESFLNESHSVPKRLRKASVTMNVLAMVILPLGPVSHSFPKRCNEYYSDISSTQKRRQSYLLTMTSRGFTC